VAIIEKVDGLTIRPGRAARTVTMSAWRFEREKVPSDAVVAKREDGTVDVTYPAKPRALTLHGLKVDRRGTVSVPRESVAMLCEHGKVDPTLILALIPADGTMPGRPADVAATETAWRTLAKSVIGQSFEFESGESALWAD
jgi:hypothetical protein